MRSRDGSNRSLAINNVILITAPQTNVAGTGLYVELSQNGSNVSDASVGAPIPIEGTFEIYFKLCAPKDLSNTPKTIQILTHGGTLDHTYWDFAPGEVMWTQQLERNTTLWLTTDLGGADQLILILVSIVQLGLQAEIAHIITNKMRSSLAPDNIPSIVGVGHSEGCAYVQRQLQLDPTDYDAIILSGAANITESLIVGTASQLLINANTDPSLRFKGLANGYLTEPIPAALQFGIRGHPPKLSLSNPPPPPFPPFPLLISHLHHPAVLLTLVGNCCPESRLSLHLPMLLTGPVSIHQSQRIVVRVYRY